MSAEGHLAPQTPLILLCLGAVPDVTSASGSGVGSKVTGGDEVGHCRSDGSFLAV